MKKDFSFKSSSVSVQVRRNTQLTRGPNIPIQPSLLFSNFVGSLYFRRIPFSDYLHIVKRALLLIIEGTYIKKNTSFLLEPIYYEEGDGHFHFVFLPIIVITYIRFLTFVEV